MGKADRFYDETRMTITRTRLWVWGAGEHKGVADCLLACLLALTD
jgi:hypothetical protein